MRKVVGIMFAIGLLAIGGLTLAACGGDDSTTATAEDTAATTTTEGDAAGGAAPDDVYTACTAALAGTPAEATAETVCGKARDVFQKCIDKAATLDGGAKDVALQACQNAADQTIERISGQ